VPVGNKAPLYDILGLQYALKKRDVKYALVVKQGQPSELKKLAAELVDAGVDVVVGIGTSGVTAAQNATATVPILFPNISDPVLGGFAKSMWKPAGNITGTSARLEQLTPQRLKILKTIMGDRLRTVMVLHRPDYPPALRAVKLMREEAARLGVEVVSATASTREGIQEALKQIPEKHVDGIIMVPEAFIAANNDIVLDAANNHRIPYMGVHDYLADWGAIGSLGTFPHGAGQDLAHKIVRIHAGERPGDMPIVDLPPYFVVNLKAAKYLGLKVPDELLKVADRVIPEDG
jgi:putative ABC transport system substrate-binding protein